MYDYCILYASQQKTECMIIVYYIYTWIATEISFYIAVVHYDYDNPQDVWYRCVTMLYDGFVDGLSGYQNKMQLFSALGVNIIIIISINSFKTVRIKSTCTTIMYMIITVSWVFVAVVTFRIVPRLSLLAQLHV